MNLRSGLLAPVPGISAIRCLLSMLCIFGGLAGWRAEAAAAGKVYSIEEFNVVSSKWLDTITVEGRWSLFVKNRVKFRNCDISFRYEKPFPATIRNTPNLEVTGKLVREEGKQIFQIESLREQPADIETFNRMRREIRGENLDAAESWYKLADWGTSRGKFYHDTDLLEQSADARLRGFKIERRQLPRGNPDALLELAARIQNKTLDIPESIRQELVHESFRIRRDSIANEKRPHWEELAQDLAQALPVAEEPATAADTKLYKEYADRPFEVYAGASLTVRRKLHRCLWSEMVLQAILQNADPDGANGFEIADAIDRRVPEYHSGAEEFRERALALRATKVEKLSRSEVLALRKEYVDRNQADQGQAVVESWLTLRQKQLESGDTEGLLYVADQYTVMLNQPEKTLRLLLEAVARHPKSPEIAACLQRLGYQWKGGRWLSAAEANAIPEGKMEQALREGRVEIGMTSQQVLKSLGAPTNTTRIVSAGKVSEIWNYEQGGGSRFTIYLVKNSVKAEAQVIGIDQL